MERYKKMGLFSTNYNLSNFDLLGNNLSYGSGISGLFSGVPGLNTSIFDYGSSYYSTGSTNSSGNSALGWALGGVGVGMVGLLVTTLISRSESNRSATEAEESSNLSSLKAALKDLGLDEDVDSVTEAAINKININDDQTLTAKFKETSIYALVKTAQEEVNKLTDEKSSFENSLSTKLEALKPDGYDGNDIELMITKWDLISKDNDTSLKEGETEAQRETRLTNARIAEEKITALKALKAEKASWDTDGENDKKLTKANEALEKAKKEAETKLDAKKTEAKKYLEAYTSSKLSNRSINDADGTVLSRLFGSQIATIDKEGNIDGKAEEFKTNDWKRILYAYRTGNSATKKKIGEWVATNQAHIESVGDKDCKKLLEIIVGKYNDNSNSDT